MKFDQKLFCVVIICFLLINISESVMTKSMMQKKYMIKNATSDECLQNKQNNLYQNPLQLNITTQCNNVDLSAAYNYSGIVRSGYLSVGKNSSVLAFTFYGKKDVKDVTQLTNIPTIIWLNGGPGSSSQFGNLRQIGPLLLKRKYLSLDVVQNQNSWANKYNLLFVDQPVGTGLSYADPSYANGSFAQSIDEVANDFYYALNQLYTANGGCFSSSNLNISPESKLYIVGQSYGGKYAPAIAKKIVTQKKNNNGFLKGLKGIAIGDGFTSPFDILSEVGHWAYHLSLLDYQQRMIVQTMLLRAAKNFAKEDYNKLHDDFNSVIDYIVQRSGNMNVYDIKIDGEYQQLLKPYFRNAANMKIFGLNTGISFDSQSSSVYTKLYTDFMKPEYQRVQYLLSENIPVLIYNGQDDLIVQNAGAMKWVDKLKYTQAQKFRKALLSPWKLNNVMVGSVKSAGLLQFRIVNNAGHMVPMDCPAASLDMISSFIQKYQ